jgi:hypothetical protein
MQSRYTNINNHIIVIMPQSPLATFIADLQLEHTLSSDIHVVFDSANPSCWQGIALDSTTEKRDYRWHRTRDQQCKRRVLVISKAHRESTELTVIISQSTPKPSQGTLWQASRQF